MSRKLLIISIVAMMLGIAFSGCEENEDSEPPVIQFKQGENFVTTDTTLAIGEQIKVGIRADCGQYRITYFNYTVETDNQTIAIDSGMNNCVLDWEKTITKGIAETEQWTFKVMDKSRQFASVSLTLHKDTTSVYGDILHYQSITMGAQENTEHGSFLSLTDGMVYEKAEADANQELIDLIYFYGKNDRTLASPALNSEAEILGVDTWDTHNDTPVAITELTETQFDAAQNDSLLIATYNPADARSKAKQVTTGTIIAFKTQYGKTGLIKVSNAEGEANGTITFDVKIQK